MVDYVFWSRFWLLLPKVSKCFLEGQVWESLWETWNVSSSLLSSPGLSFQKPSWKVLPFLIIGGSAKLLRCLLTVWLIDIYFKFQNGSYVYFRGWSRYVKGDFLEKKVELMNCLVFEKNICWFSNFYFEFTMEVSHFLTIISFYMHTKILF